MIRTLLASTALAGLLATSVLAQDTTPQTVPAAAPAADTAMPTPPADAGEYVQALDADQYLASDLTGQTLYETNAPDARSIGEIRNFVVGGDGKVAAIVIATSGLEQNKTVAAPAGRIEWVDGEDGEQRAVLKVNVGELQGAPEFMPQSARQAADNGAAVPSSGAAAPAGGTDMAANGAGGTTGQPATPNSGSMVTGSGYLAALGNDQKLSGDVIGSNVYSGPGDDAQTIGTVNDLVLTKAGEIPAAIVGVGGFLGIGEKNIGVPYRKLTVQSDDNAEPRLIMAATKDQLTAAPAFDDDGNGDQSMAANTVAAGGAAMGTGAAMSGDAQMAQGTQPTDTTAAQKEADGTAAMNADPSTTASTGNDANDRSSMKPVSGPELTSQNLDGVTVYGPNDQGIGKVGDIALTNDGRVDAIVVDVGGFLGIGSKPVAVAMDNLQFMRDTNGTLNVYTQFTEDQLKSAPEFNRESYAQNRGSMRLESSDAAAPAAGGRGSGTTTQPAQ